jgi:hypothetical protein
MKDARQFELLFQAESKLMRVIAYLVQTGGRVVNGQVAFVDVDRFAAYSIVLARLTAVKAIYNSLMSSQEHIA